MGVLYVSKTARTITNTTSELSFFSSPAAPTIPANTLVPASTFRITVRGYYSSPATLPPTLRIRAKIGAVDIADTGAVTVPISATSYYYETSVLATIESIGATGEINATGYTILGTSVLASAFLLMPAVFTNIDTTVDNLLDVTGKWGSATTGAEVTQLNAIIEISAA